MSKLEAKHVLPYVLYGAKMLTEKNLLDKEDRIWTLQPSNFPNKWNADFNSKIILRPMEDMSKEIVINGKKLVPLVELLKIKYSAWYQKKADTRYQEIEFDNISAWFSFMATFEVKVMFFTDDIFSYPEFWIMEKLNEWHFDYNGLIKQGLAVDINTLSVE